MPPNTRRIVHFPARSTRLRIHIHITADDRAPIYLQLVNQIKYLAARGRSQAGQPLPTGYRLAEYLSIHPTAVARAIRRMEASGIASLWRRAGVFVATGVLPLAKCQHNKVLHERIDTLFTVTRQLFVELETLIQHVCQRGRRIR